MSNQELNEKLQQLRVDLSKENTAIASGTKPENPGKIKELKKTIARILTIVHEREVESKK